MPLQFIKADTKFEFMNRRILFFGVSGTVILAGLIALLVFGLNLGIDFRGGTKILLRFNGTEAIDRELIRKVVADKIQEISGEEMQVEVQDFSSGGDEDAVMYMVYTESVSLITEEQKTDLVAAVKSEFGDDTAVSAPEEGGDQFYVSFADEAPIGERMNALEKIFADHGLARVNVESEKVRDLKMERYKIVNLESGEGSEGEDLLDVADSAKVEQEDALKEQLQKDLLTFMAEKKDTSYTIRIEEIKGKMEEAIASQEELAKRFDGIESATSISPSVGTDMLNNGLLAVFYAVIGILLYIALRFDFKYGPGAVVALLHDAFITVGVFAMLQVPFSLPIIAALLTIIGYSVNDTIVVFDRIRENVSKLKGLPFDRIINKSINETLSRTVLTSATSLVVVISIYVLGGGLIQDFAFALIVGIVVGTYSSIFIASPILLALDNLIQKRKVWATR